MSIATNIKTLISVLPQGLMQQLNVSGAAVVSGRTIKIGLKTPAPDGTNQIKVTVENGKFLVRGIRVEETDIAYNLTNDEVASAVLNMATGANAAANAALAAALKNASGK